MGYSTIRVPAVGFVSVNQTGHPFEAGNIIRSAGSSNAYVKAIADSADNAEVVGYVVEKTSANDFRYITNGLVTAGVPAAAAGTTFFLSPSISGALTATEPSAAGQVSKPLLTVVDSGVRGVFFNMRGVVVSTGSTSWIQTIWMPAAGMTIQTTSGAAAGSAEIGAVNMTGGLMLSTLDFDAGAIEFAQFDARMNKAWDRGNVYFQPAFTVTGTTGSVVWGCQATAFSNGDSLSAEWGNPQLVTGHATAGNTLVTAPVSAGITVTGSPAESDWVKFRAYRLPTDGSDNLAVDAKLIGASILMNVTSLTDA
jgi:hypothetical protein